MSARRPLPGSAPHRQLRAGAARQEQACRLAVPARQPHAQTGSRGCE